MNSYPSLSHDECEVLDALKAGTLGTSMLDQKHSGRDVTFQMQDYCRALHSLQTKGIISGFRAVQMASGRELPILRDVVLLEDMCEVA